MLTAASIRAWGTTIASRDTTHRLPNARSYAAALMVLAFATSASASCVCPTAGWNRGNEAGSVKSSSGGADHSKNASGESGSPTASRPWSTQDFSHVDSESPAVETIQIWRSYLRAAWAPLIAPINRLPSSSSYAKTSSSMTKPGVVPCKAVRVGANVRTAPRPFSHSTHSLPAPLRIFTRCGHVHSTASARSAHLSRASFPDCAV